MNLPEPENTVTHIARCLEGAFLSTPAATKMCYSLAYVDVAKRDVDCTKCLAAHRIATTRLTRSLNRDLRWRSFSAAAESASLTAFNCWRSSCTTCSSVILSSGPSESK